jgi:pSer/pThr/pTyr-binding forkhead associated (FHA) protein
VSGIFPEIDLDQHGGQEAGVGRMHAQMFVESSQLLLEDLDSVNGTVVNRQKLAPRKPHPIKDGDEIRLGMMVLTYRNS